MGRSEAGADALDRRLDLIQRAHRLDEEEIHPAFGQRGSLFGEAAAAPSGVSVPSGSMISPVGPIVTGDQHFVIRGLRHFARQPRTPPG